MKLMKIFSLALLVLFVMAAPALAQPSAGTHNSFTLSGIAAGAGFGAAITMLGAGMGFGKIGGAALEGMARQPEAARDISGSMIVIAALLEGATFFALIVCLLVALNVGGAGF